MNVPILEFNPSREAPLNPSRAYQPRPDMPASCLLCFFHDVIGHLRVQGLLSSLVFVLLLASARPAMPEDFTLATGTTISGEIQRFAPDGVSIKTQRGVIKYFWSHFDSPTQARLLEQKKVKDAEAKATPAPAQVTPIAAIKGTYTFGGKTSTWTAKLTAKGDGTYSAVYVSSWGGATLNYVGTIKTDLKTEISGTGKPSGGRANGTFEFSGKYGGDGVAQCTYQEVGGRRSGSMTAEMPAQSAE